MKRLIPVLLATLFASTATPAADSATAPAPTPADTATPAGPRLPDVDLTPRLLYRYLLAEVAVQRGYIADAAELYLDMAKETRDPRIARRAADVALHARRPDTALTCTRLWLELDPEAAPTARLTLVGLLAAQGKYEELGKELALLLSSEPQALGQNLMRLNRVFARTTDRAVVRQTIDTATEPYLNLPEAHFARSQAAFEAGDMPAARAAIERALALKPDWEGAALLLAQLIGNRTESVDFLTRFVARNPHANEARLALARTLVGEKRYAEARREFAALLDRNTTNNSDIVFAVAMLSLQLGDADTAERHLRRLVELGHAESAKVRYYLGQIAEEKGQNDEALRWYGEVGNGDHYLGARARAASLLAKIGRLDEARRMLSETDVATPRERAQLQIAEAQLLRDAGKLDDAHAVLAGGLARQPDQPELLYEIALLAERMGRPEELEARLRRLIEIQPEHAHAHNALGYSLAERNVRLDDARRLIDRALELAPNDPFILDSKGWVLFRQGKIQAAFETLNQAFGLRADPEIAAHLGEVLWMLGKHDEARSTWQKALQDNPGNTALTTVIKRFLP